MSKITSFTRHPQYMQEAKRDNALLDAGTRGFYGSAMTSSGLSSLDPDPDSSDFAARRAEARKRLDALDPAKQGAADPDPLRRAWFEAVYRLAENDPARVPWADLAPHPLTRTWVEGQVRGLAGLKVLEVGCGLGENAELFASTGAQVTAFDLVEEAIVWAKRKFPQSKVAYQVRDLFEPPSEWQGTFDLIHECYTLQALSAPLVPKALGVFRSLLKPDGHLLVITRARAEEDEASGPPWPLPPSFIETAREQGLAPVMIEDIGALAPVSRRHWRILFKRA